MEIGICDDEPRILEETKSILEAYLNESANHSVISFSTSTDLLSFAKKGRLDLVFMDIELKETTGIEAAKELSLILPDCQIVYLTNYIDYAVDVYETDHCYYLLKGQLKDRLPDVMKKVESRLKMLHEHLIIDSKSRKYVIPSREICYIESNKHLTFVHTQTESIETTEKLDNIADRLNSTTFVRCHKSYLISLNYIKTYSRQKFTLKQDIEIPISRRYIKSAKEAFLLWSKLRHI